MAGDSSSTLRAHTVSMRYFDGIENLTDVQIRTGREKVKRVAEEININKVCNDLRRELTMADKLSLCDNAAMVFHKPKDKRQGKDFGRVGKETAGKRNGRKSRVNGDGGVKTFWDNCFLGGDRCPTRKESDKATALPQRSSSAIVPSAGVSTGARLRTPSSASSSVPQGPASRTRSDVAGKPAVSYRTVLVETQEKEEGHADPVQRRLDMCLEPIEILCTELVGTAPGEPHAEAKITMTHARNLYGVTSPVGSSVGGLIPSGNVERIGVTRGVDIVEHSGGAKEADIEPLKYHCGAELVARGGKTMESLGFQAVLDSAPALRVFPSACWSG